MDTVKSGFFRDNWAAFDARLCNQNGGRAHWRVNDGGMSQHPKWADRWESQANGLVLIDALADARLVHAAELYLEMWGGHPHTGAKRVLLNGRNSYPLPDLGTSAGNCTYSYPVLDLALEDMVMGLNVFQFNCERGESFWGHYIVDNAAVRCYLSAGHPDLTAQGLAGFHASVQAAPAPDGQAVVLTLDAPAQFHDCIESVDYFGRYHDFDDRGTGQHTDWHGFTFGRHWQNHIGTAGAAPFGCCWDTAMLPDQDSDMAVCAEITFSGGLKYRTPVTTGIEVQRQQSVRLYTCHAMPVPFWSRDNQLREAQLLLDIAPAQIERAELHIRIWDGGEGDIAEPFTLNGHAYPITSRAAIHDVVYSVLEVAPEHLRQGENHFSLLSDTEHHGIEVLLPGPCLKVRLRA
jgi:hypothetical protein